MNLRMIRRWFVEHVYSDVIGGRGNSYKTFKSVLQYQDGETWKDVPSVDDEESLAKANQDLDAIRNPWRHK